MAAALRIGVVAIGIAVGVSPAAAQWTRIADLPASDVFTVRAKGDTLIAGARLHAYVSTNGGASWPATTQPVAGSPAVTAVLFRNGQLYAGTAGQGVFVSPDRGQTWSAFNEGLVGGVLNSQLDVDDLCVRGDSLYAATLGAGVYVRRLTGVSAWSHFGEEFEPNQASNVEAIAVGGTRLLAGAGGNGSVFFRDPGDTEWTISWLDNVGLHPGLQAGSLLWTGTGWLVGCNSGRGPFLSTLGEEPWTFVNVGLGVLNSLTFAAAGRSVFGAFNIAAGSVIEQSDDDGASWVVMDGLPGVFVYQMAMHGSDLFAARTDGLWRRATSPVSVPIPRESTGLRFTLAGAQPVVDLARFRFELPQAASVRIEVFEVTGRRVATPVQQSWSAGIHEVAWSMRDLSPGIYHARLTTAREQSSLRLVHVR